MNSESNKNKSYNIFESIKSKYILKLFLNNLQKNKLLKIIKYNKDIQNRIDININYYKKYVEILSPIVVEIIPCKNKYDKFINYFGIEESFYHIFFDKSKVEIKKNKLNPDNKIKKIKIIIDHQVKSFKGLFEYCKCIEKIDFKKFYRNNINDMSYMFTGCSSLKEINLSKFNTNNVVDISNMLWGYISLIKLDLSNFNTINVTNMSSMFSRCSSLKEVNIENLHTDNVTSMSCMFSGCSSLRVLNLSSFRIDNLEDMNFMFSGCSSLKEINFPNFNSNITNMSCMFLGYPTGLKMKINAPQYLIHNANICKKI